MATTSSASPAPRSTATATSPDQLPSAFLTSRLQKSGPYYWNRPRTADCIVVTPLSPAALHLMKRRRSEGGMDGAESSGGSSSLSSRSSPATVPTGRASAPLEERKRQRKATVEWHSSSEEGSESTPTVAASSNSSSSDAATEAGDRWSQRRQSAPSVSIATRRFHNTTSLPIESPTIASPRYLKMTFKVHSDFLMQSGLLARLFASSDSDRLLLTARLFSHSRLSCAKGPLQKADDRVRILATAPNTVIFLPLPDPSSFSYLLYYLYHGNLDPLLGALNAGVLQWQGVVANIDFLDLDRYIKQRVGRWCREHMLD